MRQLRFKELKEQLLRGGIAPKHASRYVRELEDHLGDLVREEIQNGMDIPTAERSAHKRLGDNAALSRAILSQSELKSIAARYPWLIFGIVPPLALIAIVASSLAIEAGVIALAGSSSTGGSAMPSWGRLGISIWHGLLMYVVPFIIAAVIGILGIRQRMPFAWLLLGTCIVLVLGSFLTINVVWSDLPGQSSLSVGLGLSAGEITTMQGISRLTANALAIGVLFWMWRRCSEFIRDDTPAS